MRRTIGRLFCIAAFAVLTASCGAVEYGAVILGAHEAIAEAEVAGAGPPDGETDCARADDCWEECRRTRDCWLAPYEYTYALEHLRKAREEVGQADYQAAADMGRLAREYARKARDIAVQRRREEGR